MDVRVGLWRKLSAEELVLFFFFLGIKIEFIKLAKGYWNFIFLFYFNF